MKKTLLDKNWQMQMGNSDKSYACSVPCSMYHTLIKYDVIPDPSYRENEKEAFKYSEQDCTFSTKFPYSVSDEQHVFLCFDGIDTLAEIVLNGETIAHTDNMHRRWRFDVTRKLQAENSLTVKISSPLKYIAEKQAQHPLWGVNSTVEGFPHIRKSHYMFGWDWGMKLPDMGIWRDVYLECWSTGRIQEVQYLQEHEADLVTLTVKPAFECDSDSLKWTFALYDPDGEEFFREEMHPVSDKSISMTIANPELWWANGYGKPNLYTAVILLTDAAGNALDSRTEKIGLRTLTIRQEPDEWGDSFSFCLNGVDIFAKGANWIPTDQILPNCTAKKTISLLQACKDANFNMVRVWGGGFYPSDEFYDFCDENGLIVWEDLMFACANYRLNDEFWSTTEMEIRDNIIRLRNHASLGLWCGNNEIETALQTWGLPENPEAKADYQEMFKKRIPEIVNELDEQRFYWQSSPSGGDVHNWEVWHGFQPFTAFREKHPRFCSEYGFESLPSQKTLLTVCDPLQGDLNLMSPVMEAHQKCEQGNEKIMYYLAQMVRYPESFTDLIHASQFVQAECIRSNVEHMRRNRGRCMGSLYWQLNDSNPVISWSSIDYDNRWKALHYYAKRFYAPILLTAGAMGEPIFNISNETMGNINGIIRWSIRNAKSEIMQSGEIVAEVPAMSAKFFDRIQGLDEYYTPENRRKYYLAYEFESNGEILSKGTSLLTVPKQFEFIKPEIKTELRKLPEHYILSVQSDVFVQAVELDCRNFDIPFSDNWFSLNGGETVLVTFPKDERLTLDILWNELIVRC